MIKIENVSMSYGEHKALDGVTLTIGDGSVYGLIGSNGSGKSTLLRGLCGVFSVSGGEILYDGQNVWENDKIKAGIVYLSQVIYMKQIYYYIKLVNGVMNTVINQKSYNERCPKL